MHWVPAAQAAAASPSGGPWSQLIATPTLTVGRYRLPKGGVDGQQPHDRDEVYYVIAGRAQLTAGGETRTVAAGDAVFVAAHVEHRFHDLEADLDVLVFFSAARRPTGGMAGSPPPTEQTPYPETSQRGNARIFYWFGPSSAGQVTIDHGQPRWQPAFAKFMAQPGGKRWRFGENFWTVLDTNMELQLGGVDVGIGQYYAVLEHGAGGLQLVLLDPQEVRKGRLDAFQAPETTGGLAIPLQTEKLAQTENRLAIELEVDANERDRGKLVIRFGPYRLTAPLRMSPQGR